MFYKKFWYYIFIEVNHNINVTYFHFLILANILLAFDTDQTNWANLSTSTDHTVTAGADRSSDYCSCVVMGHDPTLSTGGSTFTWRCRENRDICKSAVTRMLQTVMRAECIKLGILLRNMRPKQKEKQKTKAKKTHENVIFVRTWFI